MPQPWGALNKFLLRPLLSENWIGGPSPLKLSWIINAFKFGTLPFCLYLMNKEENYSETMITYTCLHGSYGLVWLLKEYIAPDPGWQTYVTLPSSAVVAVMPLAAYWVAPYLIAKRSKSSAPDSEKKKASRGRRIIASITFVLGTALMFGSDIQKKFVLAERKGLITDGFFALCRHPNYLGEMLIYGSLASLAVDESRPLNSMWEPWAIVGGVWSMVFMANMLAKEQRMSRHPGWAEYKKKTAFLIPFLL